MDFGLHIQLDTIKIVKEWDDTGYEKLRPDTITLDLVNPDLDWQARVILSADENWQKEIPAPADSVLNVTELPVVHYKQTGISTTLGNYLITNQVIPPKEEEIVTKDPELPPVETPKPAPVEAKKGLATGFISDNYLVLITISIGILLFISVFKWINKKQK